MKKLLASIGILLLGLSSASAQVFEDHFEDSTMRLDYVFAGDVNHQEIYLEHIFRTTRWAGRRTRLSETFLKGNGQLTVRDHKTQELIYVTTFSTLFQEWLNYDEAKTMQRAFDTSYQIPYPKNMVDITLTLTDVHQKVCASMTHTVDPKDILVRQLADRGIPYRYIHKGGDISSCVDIAIVAEGYTKTDMDKFYRDCERAAQALLSHAPFTEMKDRFNIVALAAESQQPHTSVPHAADWKATAFRTHYDTFYTDRYLTTQDMHEVYDALSGVPFEHVIVLVNSELYGGGGIYNQVTIATSDHPTFKQVLVHEFGHAYAGLGDEYAYDDMDTIWYPSDIEPWEPNITTLHDFAAKWQDMISAGVKGVGVFEGAGYQTKGCYRPAQECRMKVNEVEDFCPVCQRAIVRITDFYTSK